MGIGGWHRERMNCEGSEWSILKIFYNIDTQEQAVVHMYGFNGIQKEK